MSFTLADRLKKEHWTSLLDQYGRGVLISITVAVAAQFLSDHYGAPAMLMALLLGIAFHFLAEEGRCVSGIDFTSKTVLRVGVALLGARISFDLLISLGAEFILLIIVSVVATILFALIGARLLGRGWRIALLTGGSVAICGVSAAMAIAAVLPKNEHSERNLLFTVLSVTVLSTVAMITYPIVAQSLSLDERLTGVFIGGTIHDVAQVIGAGFSISDPTGETATIVKLIRVTLLAPVVLFFALVFNSRIENGLAEDNDVKRPALIPGFVVGFIILATMNSLHLFPPMISGLIEDISRWALLIAIAAVGMKTSLKTIFTVGGQAVVLIVSETVFIALFILIGIYLLR